MVVGFTTTCAISAYHHRHDRMVVGFTTTCAISAYYHLNLWVHTPFMARCTRYNIMWLSLSVLFMARCARYNIMW